MTAFTARPLTTNLLQNPITQSAHGFLIGQVLRFNGTDWVLAQADTGTDAQTVGMVSFVIDVNTFSLTQVGYVANLSFSVVAGDLYYLSPTTPGALTATEPSNPNIILPLFVADTPSSGYYINAQAAGGGGGSGGGLTWNTSTTDTTMASNNGYVVDSGSALTMTLPTTAAFGTTIVITDLGGAGFNIDQNSGQEIIFGRVTSTSGVSGGVDTADAFNCITLVCVFANTTFQVINSLGDFTIA